MNCLRRCWAEIDLSAIKYNIEQYRTCLKGGTELLCVVKANCYGHSDKIVVPYLEKLGMAVYLHYPIAGYPSNTSLIVKASALGELTLNCLIAKYFPLQKGNGGGLWSRT